jgi:hypothetical protein
MLSPLAGPYLVLGPFASYADMLVDDCEVAGRLLEETRRRARARGIGYIQLRSRFTHPPAGRLSIRQDATRFATWTAATAGSPDAVWDALESRARGAVRRARKHGVTVEQCRIGERFLDVFRHGMRSLGSPFHDRRFFRALQTAFGERLLCLLAVTESGSARVG